MACSFALVTMLASACAPNAIKTDDIPKALAARVAAAMQERLVILGVNGCPNSEQLGVLIGPDTVATPIRIPEVDGTITATNLLGQTIPVGSPIAYPQITLSPESEIVHYALQDPFEGGPQDSTVPSRSDSTAESFTATIAWVVDGAIKSTTAPVARQHNMPFVHVDRAKIGLTDVQPAAVIDPAIGVIGWLSGRLNSSDTTPRIVPLDGLSMEGPPPVVASSNCPAAQLARLAADPSLGRVNPYAASPPDQPKSELPAPTSFVPSVNEFDETGEPCPAGEIAASIDSYRVKTTPKDPDGPYEISVTVTVANHTTDGIIVSTQSIPITMEKGFDYLRGVEVTLGVGESKQVTFQESIESNLATISPIALDGSIINFVHSRGCRL